MKCPAQPGPAQSAHDLPRESFSFEVRPGPAGLPRDLLATGHATRGPAHTYGFPVVASSSGKSFKFDICVSIKILHILLFSVLLWARVGSAGRTDCLQGSWPLAALGCPWRGRPGVKGGVLLSPSSYLFCGPSFKDHTQPWPIKTFLFRRPQAL